MVDLAAALCMASCSSLDRARLTDDGHSTSVNSFSWNSQSNMLFLDQPANVGYSYSDEGVPPVNSSSVAAEVVWSFLQVFFDHFPKYSRLPLHIAGESYAGMYLPNLGSNIQRHNKEISSHPSLFAGRKIQSLNFQSILIGNGVTSPIVQYPAIPKYACNGPYPIFERDSNECMSLLSMCPACVKLLEACYETEDQERCASAGIYCGSMYGSILNSSLNPYDVRMRCSSIGGQPCYKQLNWIDTYLNDENVKLELGVEREFVYQGCNWDVGKAFSAHGDRARNAAALLPELLADGIRLLVYAGNADYMCNAIGNLEWMVALDNVFAEQFRNVTNQPFVLSITGKVAGELRSTGGKGAGHFTFVEIYDAGHMVAHDQPEAALDLFTRWLADAPLTAAQDA